MKKYYVHMAPIDMSFNLRHPQSLPSIQWAISQALRTVQCMMRDGVHGNKPPETAVTVGQLRKDGVALKLWRYDQHFATYFVIEIETEGQLPLPAPQLITGLAALVGTDEMTDEQMEAYDEEIRWMDDVGL